MKESRGILVKSDLSKREMRKVVMQTAEPASKREATEKLVKILNISYATSDIEHVADKATKLNAEEITQLLRILEYFEDFLNGTLGYWDTDPVDLEINTVSKPFNCKYYRVPRINKETFWK